MMGSTGKRVFRLALLGAVAALAMILGIGDTAQQAVALQDPPNCMGDICGVSSPCTAKDVQIVALDTWEVVNGDYCESSDPGEFTTVIFRAEFVAGSNVRYDPGVWIADDGGDAKTGSCLSDYLVPPLETLENYQPVFGPYWDAEDTPGSGDECGDIEQNVPTYRLIGPITLACTDTDDDGIVDPIGTCLAWNNSSGADCPANNNCPGTGSKCRCGPTPVEISLHRSDLSLIKTASQDPVLPGESFYYTIQVTNNGEGDSTGFTITDNLDPWLHYVSAINAECSAVADPNDPVGWGEDVTCHVTEDLLAGNSYNVVLNVVMHDYDPDNPPGEPWDQGPPSQIDNTACVQGNEYDINTGNNCGSDSVTTPVVLAHFQSVIQDTTVRFEWSTATEAGNAGFNLYTETETGLQRINGRLIPSHVVDSVEPQNYSFSAAGIAGDRFYLEEVSVRTQGRLYGPFQLGESYGTEVKVEPIDWAGIRAEHEGKVTLDLPRRSDVRQEVPKIELLIDQDGLYRVTYEDLLAAGFDLAGVKASDLAVTSQGAPVRLRVSSGRFFGPGAYIEFYGQAVDTLYTRTNVYALQVNRELASRVRLYKSRPLRVPHAPYYMETTTVDQNREYSFLSPNGDPWYDSRMMVHTSPQTWSFDIEVTDYVPSTGPSSLSVGIWGLSEWPVSPDHHVIVSLNGEMVADGYFDGLADHPIHVELPQDLLQEGSNTLELTLPGDTGADWDIVVLDRYSVTYPRAFIAQHGRLSFTAAGEVFRVSGLPSPDVVVYRIEGDSVAELGRVGVGGSGGAYWAVFAGTLEPATYLVYDIDTLLEPGIRPARPEVDITSGTAQYRVISHSSFLDGLAPLIAAREAQGLDVRVVDVDDVYAQFGYGVFGAGAIRDYVAYAAANMGTEYILLVGGDTYDYFDYLNQGSMSFIPSLYAATDYYASWAPVDPLYVDVDSDGIPDLAIGRLPVRTSAELDMAVAKTLAYAEKSYGGTAVFAADDGFTADSVSFSIQLPEGWALQTAYLDELGVEGARAALIDAINGGVALTSFVGHSGTTVWTFDGLFSASDAAALTNHGQPTVVSQWGCWNTYYVAPSYNTMAHKFMLSGEQGAAAVLGSTTISYDLSERALGRLLTPRLVEPGLSIGAALQVAKAELAETHPAMADVLLGWTILGDPALVIQP